MFDRYTERARRVIFFARYEASQFGGTAIESHHLLLGLFREDKNLLRRLGLSSPPATEGIGIDTSGLNTFSWAFCAKRTAWPPKSCIPAGCVSSRFESNLLVAVRTFTAKAPCRISSG
jgi:hypothetical protein